MAELTAAEKAEQRRQKVLAKKKARMAFVTQGDRSQLPSSTDATATGEPQSKVLTEPSSLPAVPATPLLNGTTQSTRTSIEHNQPPAPFNSCTTTTTTAPTATLDIGPSITPSLAYAPAPAYVPPPRYATIPAPSPPSPRRQAIVSLVRILLLVMAAVLVPLTWPDFSAVKSFICLRALFQLPSVKLSQITYHLTRRRPKWTYFDIITSLPQAYVTIQSAWQEFALYMTVTLLTISLMRTTY